MIQAVDLLLQERVPRDATAAPPRAEEVPVTAVAPDDAPVVRRFDTPGDSAADRRTCCRTDATP